VLELSDDAFDGVGFPRALSNNDQSAFGGAESTFGGTADGFVVPGGVEGGGFIGGGPNSISFGIGNCGPVGLFTFGSGLPGNFTSAFAGRITSALTPTLPSRETGVLSCVSGGVLGIGFCFVPG